MITSIVFGTLCFCTCVVLVIRLAMPKRKVAPRTGGIDTSIPMQVSREPQQPRGEAYAADDRVRMIQQRDGRRASDRSSRDGDGNSAAGGYHTPQRRSTHDAAARREQRAQAQAQRTPASARFAVTAPVPENRQAPDADVAARGAGVTVLADHSRPMAAYERRDSIGSSTTAGSVATARVRLV